MRLGCPVRDPKTGRFPKGNGSGRGGPAKGHGWGGPPKGASNTRIKPGDPEGIQALSNDAEIKARAAARTEALLDHLFHLSLKAQREETQLAASVAYLNRVEGMPVARTLNTNVSDPSLLSDAELAAIAAAGRAAPVAPDTE